jgi:bacillithiol synthase
MKELISPTRAMGYPGIFLDFVMGAESARHFYLANNPGDVASKLDAIPYDRVAISRILLRQNESFGAGAKALSAIDQLVDPRALVVATGQQCVLFGGPLLILLKAVALAKAAVWLEKELNRPVIPIFWIAADDHDFPEINSTWLAAKSGELTMLSYNADSGGKPASDILLDDSGQLTALLDSLKSSLGESEFTPWLYDILHRAYAPGKSFVDSFGTYMAAITGDLGIPMFSPSDPDVKQLSSDFFEKLLTRQAELHEVITATNREIVQHGYHIQAEKSDDSMHLFMHTPSRNAIHRNGDGCICGEKRFALSELSVLVREKSWQFSTDVITRPILQSHLFPVVSQIGGPSEIAYLAQINPLFRVFDLATPYYIARPSATLLERRPAKQMHDYGIAFDELPGDVETVINRVMAKSFPKDVELHMRHMSTGVNEAFHADLESIISFDPALAEFAKQSYGKIDFTMKSFQEKIFSSHKRKQKETRERIYRLWNVLFPNRALQERVINSNYFLARYGTAMVKMLYDQLSIHEAAHQLIRIGDEDSA